jgi:hypothetical protein
MHANVTRVAVWFHGLHCSRKPGVSLENTSLPCTDVSFPLCNTVKYVRSASIYTARLVCIAKATHDCTGMTATFTSAAAVQLTSQKLQLQHASQALNLKAPTAVAAPLTAVSARRQERPRHCRHSAMNRYFQLSQRIPKGERTCSARGITSASAWRAHEHTALDCSSAQGAMMTRSNKMRAASDIQ